MSKDPLVAMLQANLPYSNGANRKNWASQIVEERIPLKDFNSLLFSHRKVAMPFMWLLTEIGEHSPAILLGYLPYVMDNWGQIAVKNKEASLANYWLVAGVPEVNEAKAITMLFEWLQESKSNLTTKSRALFVLQKLAIKYPELQVELKLSLEDQLDKNSADFKKRALKVLERLESDSL